MEFLFCECPLSLPFTLVPCNCKEATHGHEGIFLVPNTWPKKQIKKKTKTKNSESVKHEDVNRKSLKVPLTVHALTAANDFFPTGSHSCSTHD